MEFREVVDSDAKAFLELLIVLDNETEFMLYEPGERDMTIEQASMMIASVADSGGLIFGAFDGTDLLGFSLLKRGFVNRNMHSGYLVIGVKSTGSGQGIGTNLLKEIEKWAVRHDITRLELTVMKHNHRAFELYKKCGYEVEGTKRNSLIVNGSYVDEYYMGKLLV